MKRYIQTCFCVLIAFAFVSAQEKRGHMNPEEVEKKIDQRLLLKLSDELNVNDEQLIKISNIVKSNRTKRHELEKNIETLRKELRECIKDSACNEGKITKKLDAFRVMRKQMFDMEEEKLNDIEKVLTVKQAAKFIILEKEFRNDIWQMMRKRIEEHEK